MPVTSIRTSRSLDVRRASPITNLFSWLTRPHAAAVHTFRVAAEEADVTRLAALLDPAVAVVVDAGTEQPTMAAVQGRRDAIPVLLDGLRARPALTITERAVNGQAGLMLSRGGELIALITIDFTSKLITMIWVRLRPTRLRHWNAV